MWSIGNAVWSADDGGGRSLGSTTWGTLTTRTSNAGHDDIVGIHIQSKVLEGVAIMGGVRLIGFGQLKRSGIIFGKMLDVIFPECRYVVETMKKVGAEVGVGLALGYCVAQRAELF